MVFKYLVTFLLCTISFKCIECQIFCDVDAKCADNGICNKELGLCECKNGLIYNIDNTKCLPVASTPTYSCEDDRQCEAIVPGGIECRQGFCACRQGYQYFKNRCMEATPLGGACTSNDECDHGNLGSYTVACIDKECKCASGYYKRLETDCRKSGKVHEFCLLASDCDTSLFCNMITMTCEEKADIDNSFKKESSDKNIKPSRSLSPKALDLTEKCSKSTPCKTKGAFCSLVYQRCVCNVDTLYDQNTGSCKPALGGQCKKDEACVSNSHCVNDMCVCKDRYYYGDLGQKCFKPARRLGDSCLHNRNCLTFGPNGAAVCSARACRCAVGYKYDTVNSLCVKAGGDGNICVMDADCAGRRNTHCDPKLQRCVCNDHYHPLSEEVCMPDLGAPCSDGVCDGQHVECRAGLCHCEKNYAQYENSCLKYVEDIEDNCVEDVQCKGLLHKGGICQKERCVCEPGYIYVNKTVEHDCVIKKSMGDMCSKRSDCRVGGDEYLICQNSICVCEPGTHATQGDTKCISGTGKTILNSVLFSLIAILLVT